MSYVVVKFTDCGGCKVFKQSALLRKLVPDGVRLSAWHDEGKQQEVTIIFKGDELSCQTVLGRIQKSITSLQASSSQAKEGKDVTTQTVREKKVDASTSTHLHDGKDVTTQTDGEMIDSRPLPHPHDGIDSTTQTDQDIIYSYNLTHPQGVTLPPQRILQPQMYTNPPAYDDLQISQRTPLRFYDRDSRDPAAPTSSGISASLPPRSTYSEPLDLSKPSATCHEATAGFQHLDLMDPSIPTSSVIPASLSHIMPSTVSGQPSHSVLTADTVAPQQYLSGSAWRVAPFSYDLYEHDSGGPSTSKDFSDPDEPCDPAYERIRDLGALEVGISVPELSCQPSELEQPDVMDIGEAQKLDKGPRSRRDVHKSTRFCKFCRRQYKYLAKHLLSAHPQEPEVISYQACTTKKTKRSYLVTHFITPGDALYNEMNPDKHMVVRRGSKDVPRTTCTYCKRLISMKHVRKHIRESHPDQLTEAGLTFKTRTKRKRRMVPEVHPPRDIDPFLNDHVLQSLNSDNHRTMIVSDAALLEHGNALTRKTRTDKNRKRTIASSLRIICHIVSRMQRIDPTINTPTECAFNNNYKTFTEAILSIAKGGLRERCETPKPSLVDQYALTFKRFVETVESLYLGMEDGRRLAEPASTWLSLYEKRFSFEVGHAARKEYQRQKFDTRTTAPNTHDVKLLNEYIVRELAASLIEIEENPQSTYQQYLRLAEVLLMRLWTFNRRRVGEIDRLELKRWNAAKAVKEDSAEFALLSPSEKSVSHKSLIVTIQAKRGKPAFILVPKSEVAAINKMIELRELVGIPSSNIYLFAKGESFLEGTLIMRKFAENCGAAEPSLLRGTKLRHHAAITMQYLNLSAEDLRLMTQRMGHSVDVHLEHYREDAPELHLGRAAKVLMAWDKGVLETYKGKNLDELPDLASDPESDDSEEVIMPYSNQPSTSTSEPTKFLGSSSELPREMLSTTPHSDDSDTTSDQSVVTKPTTKRRRQCPGKRLVWTKSPLKSWIQKNFKAHIDKEEIPSRGFCKIQLSHRDVPPHLQTISPTKVKLAVSNLLKKKRKEALKNK